MNDAFSLLRVSSSGQTRRAGADEGYSIEMQRAACQRTAERLGAEIVEEFIAPAESASRGFYATLTQMLTRLKERGDISYVIVYKLDRFARDELTNFAAYAEIKGAGAELVSATENIDGTPQGMLMHGILASINAFYSRDLAQKITDGRVMKAKLGGTPFRAKLGYLNKRRWDGSNDIRYIELDPERAPHILWAFQAYATGDWPLSPLVDVLYDRGLRSRPTPKRPAGKVSRSTLHEILRDPYYIGTVVFRGIEYQGDHPKLVTPELFDQVQQVLTARSVAGEQHWKHEHYLKGTVYCGLCGRRLIFTKCTGRLGGKYDYFVCGGRHDGSGCDLPYLAAARVENDVADHYLREVKLDAERVAALEPRLVELFRHLTGHRAREAERWRTEISDVLGQRRLLVEDHLANPRAIPLDVLEEQQAELGQRLKSAQVKLATAERDVGQAEEGLRKATQLLRESSTSYRQVNPQTRRRWNQVFFTKLWVGPEGVTGAELTEALGHLLADDLAEEIKKMPSKPSVSRAWGSNSDRLVELAGLEPATS